MNRNVRENKLLIIITLGILVLLISLPISNASTEELSNEIPNDSMVISFLNNKFEFNIKAENETDADQDGMPDAWELENDLDIERDDSAFDYDFDELKNIEEYEYGTDPWNEDSDGDRFNDGFEVFKGTNPADAESHPVRIWLYILIGVLSIALIAGIVWVTIITRKDFKSEKKNKSKTNKKKN